MKNIILLILPIFLRTFTEASYLIAKPYHNISKTPELPFSYHENDSPGPLNWNKKFKICDGLNQSPIDLRESDFIYDGKVTKIKVKNFDKVALRATIANNGHTVKIKFQWDGEGPTINGGLLHIAFKLAELHYHWGLNNRQGSEHKIGGKTFPMEAHLVFYNPIYKTVEEAKSHENGLAVVAILYEIGKPPKKSYNPVIRYLKSVIEPHTEVLTEKYPFAIDKILGDIDWNGLINWRLRFILYQGSLTTPPCTEGVTWIVALKPILIRDGDMQAFRKLKSSEGSMIQNFRPTQNLNNRSVFYY